MDATAEPPPPPGIFVNYCSHVHWTAMASASNGTDVAANAVDSNLGTRWTTGMKQSGSDFLQIDLGAVVTLSQLVLSNPTVNQGDYPRAYSVLLSTDGVTFPTTAATGTIATAPGLAVTIPFTQQPARAVKVIDTGTATVWWSVGEVTFTCQLTSAPPAGSIDPYDPVSWKATASASAGGAPSNAYDGNYLTRWSTGKPQAGGEWFLLDLGAVTAVSQLSIDAGGTGDFPAAYKLEVSVDGQTYVQVGAGAGTQVMQVQFASQSARYFRITQTGVDPNHWWSIEEMSIKQ
jgi:hypothetical protein